MNSAGLRLAMSTTCACRAVVRGSAWPIGGDRAAQRRFENIITYLRHRVTNAASESINAKIQWVRYTARGFRNLRNFIHAIYFHCGGVHLAPATH